MIVLIGCSHHSAPLPIRERMAVRSEDLGEALRRLTARPTIHEALILSTCNRVEFLVRGSDFDRCREELRAFVAETGNFSDEELERYLYHVNGSDAVRHLLRVASGLDSMIVGEPQILGQVKQAYLAAQREGSLGTVLERLMQFGLASAKRVRTETGIARHAVSVAFAAVQLGRRIFGKLEGRRVLLLGAGKMSFLVARHLVAQGVEEVIVTSRRYTHAVETAEKAGGRAVNWDDGRAMLAEVDIVVSCTDAPHVIVTRQEIIEARKKRRGEPLFLIDIAVPRDFDPSIQNLDNVYLYDIDALQDVVDANLSERQDAASEAERRLDEDVRAFEQWRQTQRVAPAIRRMQQRILGLCEQEMNHRRSRLGSLSAAQQEELERMTRSIARKIMHQPIRRLRESVGRGDMERCLRLYDEIFALSATGGDDQAATGAPTTAGKKGKDQEHGTGPTGIVRGGKEPGE